MNEKNHSLILALSYMDFLKTREKLLLLSAFDSVEALASTDVQRMSQLVNRRLKTKFDMTRLPTLVRQGENALKFYNIKMLSMEDIPLQLREIPDPPFSLFVRGTLPDVGFNMLAIVGTRYPTGEGLQVAIDLGKECASLSIPLVSGLARGIDCYAQRGCVEAGGASVGVLACGVERVYPASNARLAQKIISSKGCLLSEYPPFTEPLKFRFPQRNRIISGLSRYVIVVEAPAKSGALITADFALEQGRDVFVCKNILNSKKNEGSLLLAHDGAFALQSIKEILEEKM